MWSSETPMTMGQLKSKRDEFWDTEPAFHGRAEIWQALKAAAECEDADTAQAIISAISVTYAPRCPHAPWPLPQPSLLAALAASPVCIRGVYVLGVGYYPRHIDPRLHYRLLTLCPGAYWPCAPGSVALTLCPGAQGR